MVRMPNPTPICVNPLATAAIPNPLLQRIFHVAMEKGLVPLVLLPPSRGGVNAVNIIVADLISN